MIRVLAWVVKKTSETTLIAILMLILIHGIVIEGLASVVRGVDSWLLFPIAILALFSGWLAARTTLKEWFVGFFAIVFGAFAALVQVGNLGSGIILVLRATANFAINAAGWPRGDYSGMKPFQNAFTYLMTDLNVVGSRVSGWLVGLFAGKPIYDAVAVGVVWSFFIWIVIFWSAWVLRRRSQPLLSVVPAGLLLAYSLYYSYGSASYVSIFLAVTLFLLIFTRQVKRERSWIQHGIDYPSDIWLDLAFAGSALSILLVTLAVVVPSISIAEIADKMRKLTASRSEESERIADSVGLVASPLENDALEGFITGGLPRRHLIGSGPELGEQVQIVVEVQDLTARSSPGSFGETNPPFYWRSFTYDTYTGQGWETDETRSVAYRAGEDIDQAAIPGYHLVRLNIRYLEELAGSIHTAGRLISVNRDYRVAWRDFQSHEDNGVEQVKLSGDIFGVTSRARRYTTLSQVPRLSVDQLKKTTNQYPQSISDRYLVLPPDVSDRIKELARNLTVLEPTPYDQARAIETFLREFPYTLDIPQPPPNREIADYFIFDLKRGYCDYYATSMVVLARAAGLPARVVMGYASGEFNKEINGYVVSAANAHSWVEVYFPEYGWVEFEPTAGLPAINRPVSMESTGTPDLDALPSLSPYGVFQSFLSAIYVFFLTVGSGIGVFCGWIWYDNWRLRRSTPKVAIRKIYQRLYRFGIWMAIPVETGFTPLEYIKTLQRALLGWIQGNSPLQSIEEVLSQIDRLAAQYISARYSQRSPDENDQEVALSAWKAIHGWLWLAFLKQRFKELIRRT